MVEGVSGVHKNANNKIGIVRLGYIRVKRIGYIQGLFKCGFADLQRKYVPSHV